MSAVHSGASHLFAVLGRECAATGQDYIVLRQNIGRLGAICSVMDQDTQGAGTFGLALCFPPLRPSARPASTSFSSLSQESKGSHDESRLPLFLRAVSDDDG